MTDQAKDPGISPDRVTGLRSASHQSVFYPLGYFIRGQAMKLDVLQGR